MTYKNWCKHSTEIIAEADKHNKWADKAKANLLTKVGPRIAQLGRTGYMGCGFHYSLEQTFGRLIDTMTISWQPCANWCKNVERDRDNAMISEVIYESLLEQVRKAEKSVSPLKCKICKHKFRCIGDGVFLCRKCGKEVSI